MMIRKELLVAVSVLILLGVPFISVASLIGDTKGLDAEPGIPTIVTTDYVVTSGEIKEIVGQEWEIDADILVGSGGILYINNTKLSFGGTTDGQFGIFVDLGGELYIDDGCNFTAQDTTTHQHREKQIGGNSYVVDAWGTFWKFRIEGKARINNSEFSYIWGETGGYITDHEGGILCANDDIIIYNCKIQYVECAGITIFNPNLSDGLSQASGYSPTIDKVTIDNTTRYGIFVGGDLSSPTITNSTIMGAPVQGLTYFVGADGFLGYCTISGNGDGLEHDPVAGMGYSGTLIVESCNLDGNLNSGYLAGRGGTVEFMNSTFNNNDGNGTVLQTSSDQGTQTVNMYDCEVIGNGDSGLTATSPEISGYFYNVEVANNGLNGIWLPGGGASLPIMVEMDIHNNGIWGLYSNGSAGVVRNSRIYQNVIGNVIAVNDSSIQVYQNNIYDSPYGALVLSSNPTFYQNMINDNDVGIDISGPSSPQFVSGDIENNRIGISILSDDVDLNGQNITGNTGTGVVISDSDGSMVSYCNISNNAVGIKIIGGDHNRIRNTTVLGSSGSGVYLASGANITIRGSGFSSNSKDITLNEGSIARAYSLGTSATDVNVMDETSEFWHMWKISVEVLNNVTLAPVTQADLIIYSAEGEMLASDQTFFDGTSLCEAAEFSVIGSTVTDYTPVNITVSKDGFVPHWGPGHPHTGDHNEIIYIAENKAPSLPIPINGEPVITHQNRPLITWDLPYDWNDDRIEYIVNVWQDDMGTGPPVVIDSIAKSPSYQFTKNLRYNREYWVEIFAFDPWGLNDTATFSFRTVNTPPTTPEASFVESPVPSLINLVVRIDNGSTDEDTNPIDDISYLVQWEAFREDTWVIITTGSNAFVLDYNLTREGDKIRATIKPFDGIEYGISIILLTDVVNFAPEALVKYVEIELIEDTPESGLLNLSSLFSDRDGDSLSFTVSVERRVSAEIDQATNEIRFIPDLDWSGNDYLRIEALDSKPHMTDNPTIQINVTVIAVNDAPVILEVNGKIIDKGERPLVQDVQGANVIITVKGYDPDEVYGDEIQFSTNFAEVVGVGVLDEDDLIFEKTTGRMSLYLKNAIVGEHLFNITITDSSGESTSMPIKLLVDNRNDAPTVPVITSHEDGQTLLLAIGEETVTFTIAACDDPDIHIPNSEETLIYDWNFGESWEENKGISMDWTFKTTGEYLVKVRVTDSMGLIQVTTITLNVNVTKEDYVLTVTEDDETFLEGYGLIALLLVVLLIVIIVIVLVIIRKDDLSDTAEDVEKEHEALVAKQQQDALVAQDKLEALMSGVPFSETAGPALPAGQPGLEALPAASLEAVPMEGQDSQPPMDQYPPQEGYQEPPEGAYAPPEQPMQAAPAPTEVPAPEAPPAPEPSVASEAPGAVPPSEPGQESSYLPPQE